jgi:hypothetical protein
MIYAENKEYKAATKMRARCSEFWEIQQSLSWLERLS